jgi:hypothetical protein
MRGAGLLLGLRGCGDWLGALGGRTLTRFLGFLGGGGRVLGRGGRRLLGELLLVLVPLLADRLAFLARQLLELPYFSRAARRWSGVRVAHSCMRFCNRACSSGFIFG